MACSPTKFLSWGFRKCHEYEGKCSSWLFILPISSVIYGKGALFTGKKGKTVSSTLQAKGETSTLQTMGWFPLSHNFSMRMHAGKIYVRKWKRGDAWKATRRRKLLKVERRATLTFTRSLPYSVSIYFARKRRSWTLQNRFHDTKVFAK